MMPFTLKRTYWKKCIVCLPLCILAITMIAFLLLGNTGNSEAQKEARRILPGYTIVFNGRTNEIQRCESLRAFSRQYEMMEYLQIFAPKVEFYHHPTNHPIMIYETKERVILELPTRFLFEPYNWKVFWGSYYNFRMEIDKKTKKVLMELVG